MKKFISIILFSISISLYAQTDKDFDCFGRLIFRQLTTTHRIDSIPLMRMREVRDFLGKQINDSARLAKEIYIRDAGYGKLYLSFQNSVLRVKNAYQQKKDIQLEYLDTYHEKLEDNLDHTHLFIVSFLYKEGDLETEVQFTFDTAWYNEDFVFLGPLKENF